jgi:hypothetical protein
LTICGLSKRGPQAASDHGSKAMRKSFVLAALLVIVLLALLQFGPSILYGG